MTFAAKYATLGGVVGWKRQVGILFLCVPPLAEGRAEVPALTTVAEVNRFADTAVEGSRAFAVTGLVYSACRRSLFVEDGTGRFAIHERPDGFDPAPGSRVALDGTVEAVSPEESWIALARGTILGESTPPEPRTLALDELDERSHDLLEVVVTGKVMLAFDDEIDADYRFLILKGRSATLPVAFPRSAAAPDALVNATVRVRGVYYRTTDGLRKHSGPFIDVESAANIEVLTPPPADPFAAPPFPQNRHLTPHEIAALGRCTVRGTVTAAWGDRHLMLRGDNARTIVVELADGAQLPAFGTGGTAVGYPETDLFQIHLSGAQFRVETPPDPTRADGETPAELDTGDSAFAVLSLLGRLVCVRGTLLGLPDARTDDRRLILSSAGRTIFVDVSSAPSAAKGLVPGSQLAVTGRCLVTCERQFAGSAFPRLKNLAVVVRNAGDIRVCSRPPWWTPARLIVALGILGASLVAFVVWTIVLRRLVNRRTRQLLRTKVRNIQSAIRFGERTRLAVELHDTLSQTLAGTAMRVDAARGLLESDLPKARQCLDLASRALAACRNDLRGCIWDLRNHILDETDLGQAVRKTALPILGQTELDVRLDIPRSRLSDNVLHALLCILRELIANAIRHGAAHRVAVAGELADGRLVVTVADDGAGFDPGNRPGLDEGHFGLQGVGERLRRFGGGMEIRSAPGKGTRITLWLRQQS